MGEKMNTIDRPPPPSPLSPGELSLLASRPIIPLPERLDRRYPDRGAGGGGGEGWRACAF